MVNIPFTFCGFFPSFISNTSTVSINFGATLDAQNAGNGISVLQISKMFWGSKSPDPPPHSCVVCRSHTWPSAIAIPLLYYLTERSLFKKCPPTGKSLKKALYRKTVLEYAISRILEHLHNWKIHTYIMCKLQNYLTAKINLNTSASEN